METYIEVNARDADGVITEIEILWDDGSITYAHSYPCFGTPAPEPGDLHRFWVSNPYADAGRYKVRYVVHSTSGCGLDAFDQHSRVYKTWVTAG